MNYLLSGSFAYDTILLFHGKLETHILPESISRLNVSFLIDSTKDEFGGTGGNIAYNASLLGDKPMLLGVLGENDSTAYIKHLKSQNANIDNLTILEDQKCPHAWILTDSNNNQITSFSIGAMKYKSKIPDITPDIWHLAPENPLTSALLAKTATEQNKKFFFDPGQCLPAFIGGTTNTVFSLKEILENSSGIFVNDYEWELLANHLKVESPFDFLKENQFLVRTLGGKGVDLFYNGKHKNFEVVHTNKIVDPTGCGDSFRAGFLYAYTRKYSLEEAVQLGAVMGHYAIEQSGGQNHKQSHAEIMQKWEEVKNSYLKKKKPHL